MILERNSEMWKVINGDSKDEKTMDNLHVWSELFTRAYSSGGYLNSFILT